MISHNRPNVGPDDSNAVVRVLRSQHLAEGKITRKFETAVAKTLHLKYAQATSSGTTALHLALLALGIKPGHEVIVSSYACTALLNAIHYVGAKPRIADIDELTLSLSPKTIKPHLTRKTKAIVVHHMFGLPAVIEAIKQFNVPIIEDCAQSLGSQSQGKPLGSFGDITVCSFYATKMMTAGYGGMLLTDHKKYIATVRDLTNFDGRKDYKVRYNYKLSDFAAALGLSQLKKLNAFVNRRRQLAGKYSKILRPSLYFFWEGGPEDKPNYYRFVMGGNGKFQGLVKKFAKKGIQVTSPLEPYQTLHRYLGLSSKKYPVSEFISRSLVSVPIYPALRNAEVSRILKALRQLAAE